MKLFSVLLLLCSLISLASPLSATEKPPAEFFARQIVDHLISIQHDEAEKKLQQLEQFYPDYPLNGFYHAASIWAKAQDVQDTALEDLQYQAISALNKAIKQANHATQEFPDSIDWQMSLGLSHTFIARIYLQQSRWIKAYRHIRKGRDRLRKILNQDPDYADAWFTLGLYEYYTGSVPRHLKWLTRIIDLSGDRKSGIDYIIRSIKSAPVASPEAARILLDEVKPPSCGNLALAKQMQSQYPENPQFSLIIQRHLIYCGYPENALKELELIKTQYPDRFQMFENQFVELQLAALASTGNYQQIENQFEQFGLPSDRVRFYLARSFDRAQKRAEAIDIYQSLQENSGELREWQKDSLARHLKNPYRAPRPRADTDNGLRITLAAEIKNHVR